MSDTTANVSTTSVILCGVGGQGVLLASELLARAAVADDNDVKQTEVHGVSQRGGSVHSHVRFGPRVFSPLVAAGSADVIFGMEKLEALRFAHYVSPGGIVLVNEHEVLPLSIGAAADTYPHDSITFLRDKDLHVVAFPASELALELGNIRTANVLMLGALSQFLDIPDETWQAVLHERIPERYLDLNFKAFAKGAEQASLAMPA